MKIPVLVPLGTGSHSDDWELRLLLRSMDRHLHGVGEVYLITTNCPNWVNRNEIKVVPVADRHSTCKDANLWEKVIKTLRLYGIGEFIFCADDNLFMQDVEATDIPTLYNSRGIASFQQPPETIWRKRMAHTLDWANGFFPLLDRNFDVHAPQIFNGNAILQHLENAPWDREPGLGIYTAWRVLEHLHEGKLPEMAPQSECKLTLQNECTELIQSMSDSDFQGRLFLGYNDGAVAGGLIPRLKRIFPEKCRYEKEGAL